MRGKTKVVVKKKSISDLGNYKVGDTGYIDGYVAYGGGICALVVFENGDIEDVYISSLRALEEI